MKLVPSLVAATGLTSQIAMSLEVDAFSLDKESDQGSLPLPNATALTSGTGTSSFPDQPTTNAMPPTSISEAQSGAGPKQKQPEMAKERHANYLANKSRRMRERRERVRKAMAGMVPESRLYRLSSQELSDAHDRAVEDGIDKREHQWIRRAWGNGGGNYGDQYSGAAGLIDPGTYYDKWQQAYRMLGGFIDCTHSWGEGSHDSGDQNNGNDQNGACSRWMMWAAYIDPNYEGNGYDEYFGDDAPGVLDCHSPDTEWELIGVYRQEHYQYIEQISKHLWAIDDYEYIVALAGLDYMTDDECFGVGYDENGNQLYASVQPLPKGYFQMSLYSDAQCLFVNENTGYTYDDFAATSDLYLGSKDQTDDDAFRYQAYQYWQDTQEYTLTNLNSVYDDYKYCTSCVDYPTYQDGYFIGDDGTDDDDLINQCWKFYSHDSFNCDADCIAMGSQQGTITWISYNGRTFGQMMDNQYSSETQQKSAAVSDEEAATASNARRMERLKANLFLTLAGIIFVATFLAFAVARGSSKKKSSSSRSRNRRLLDDYQGSSNRRSARSSRSRSKSRRAISSEKSPAKPRSKSRGASSRSRSKNPVRNSSRGDYVPPSDVRSERSDRKKRSASVSRRKTSGSSRRYLEDF